VAQPGRFGGEGVSSLVTPSWLAARADSVKDGSLVLLDASIHRDENGYGDGRADYEIGHLPGAQFADLFTQFSDFSVDFAFAAPGSPQLQSAAREVGIGEGTTVVLYDRLSGAWAARLWWVFQAYGIGPVFVLDGGQSAWTSAGFELTTGPDAGPVRPGDVTVRPQEGFFVGLDQVKALSEKPSEKNPVICALRGSEFDKGHIPNSASLPYSDLLAGDGTVDQVKARSAAQGYADQEQVVLYCGGAINAAGLALALTEGGLPVRQLTIYDGSLSEWKADPARPLSHR
jgi:thiosulfate/3-mercaptopyruvate sulfurtransferase